MLRLERFSRTLQLIGFTALLLVFSFPWTYGPAQAKGDSVTFESLGVAAAVSESRGALATTDSTGRRLVLALAMDRYEGALRTSLLVIDVDSGEAEQFWFPAQNAANGPAYSLLLGASGRLYTTFNSHFVVFDVEARRWHFTRAAGEAMSLAEAPNGTVYFATYPTSSLYSYDPSTGVFTHHGRLDLTEQYPNSLAVGTDGWVYAGLGTARSNLVAFLPATGSLRQLIPESERRVGTGMVWIGTDGAVYGRPYDSGPIYALENGAARPSSYVPAQEGTGALHWSSVWRDFGDGTRLIAFDLPGNRLQVADTDGNVHEIRFGYVSEGTEITSLVTGPDGKIYGSTSHPMHFFVYDPPADELTDLGPIERIGGGNFAGMVAQGEFVLGAAYAGGYLYAFDTTRPFHPTQGNPRLLAEYPGAITRPRALLAHPDGEHVLMAGFAGYGLVGGGLAIFNRVTGQSELIPNSRLAPGHSIITMGALPNGDIVAGTSVEAPGGGTPTARVARLLIFDWSNREVVFSFEPLSDRSVFGTATIPGAREIVSVAVYEYGMVYGLASDGQFFVFDPAERKIVHRSNLGLYGTPVRADQAFIRTPEGRMYALLTGGIVSIEPETYAYELVAVPPVRPSAGIAYLDGCLYFASGTRLWRAELDRR